MRSKLIITIPLFVILSIQATVAQDSSDIRTGMPLPGKLFSRLEKKAVSMEQSVTKRQQRILYSLAKSEQRMKRKLLKKNPGVTESVFSSPDSIYKLMAVQNAKNLKSPNTRGSYKPYIDTLTTSMKLVSSLNGQYANKATSTAASVSSAAKTFDGAKSLNALIEERKKYLQEQLTQLGLGKDLGRYKKQFYYYKAQIKEYEQYFTTPSKIESKVLAMARESSAFQSFFQRNSQLANLFGTRLSSTETPQVILEGLSSRTDVQQSIMQRLGTNILPKQIQQQVSGAQTEMKRLKEKAESLRDKQGDPEMPNFKPNNQKSKRFADRLEYGINTQSTKTAGLLPATSDIGASIGYRLNDKSLIGIGGSYKIGWGQNIRHIRVSHEGVGVRTFAEYKLKGSFWFSGGAELNFRSAFENIEVLQQYSAWQQSALAGISKKYNIGGKKKGNVQLLYDFLHAKQVPRTQPVVFRFGYQFK